MLSSSGTKDALNKAVPAFVRPLITLSYSSLQQVNRGWVLLPMGHKYSLRGPECDPRAVGCPSLVYSNTSEVYIMLNDQLKVKN